MVFGWIVWVVTNAVGFTLGQTLRGEPAQGIFSHLIYGAVFGWVQWLFLSRHFPRQFRRLWWWLPAMAVGFTAGVTLAAPISLALTGSQTLLGIIYGTVVGSTIGVLQGLVLRRVVFPHPPMRYLRWLPISPVAFAFRFVPESVPLVGGFIGAILGAGLLWPLRNALEVPVLARSTAGD